MANEKNVETWDRAYSLITDGPRWASKELPKFLEESIKGVAEDYFGYYA